MPGSLPVLLNGSSGSGHGEGVAARIEQQFRAAGATARVEVLESGAALIARTKKLVHEKAPRIVAPAATAR